MQKKFLYSYVVIAAAVFVLLSPVAAVLAERGQANQVKAISHEKETAEGVEGELRTQKVEAARKRAEAKKVARLAEAKLKACQAKAKNIESRTNKFVGKVEKQLQTFTRIEDKVWQFAEDKQINVADKEALSASIKAKGDQVQTDLDKLKADAEAFSCEGDNPRGQLEAFLAQAQLVRSDLKAYRVAVRELIQTVRQANGQNRGTDDGATQTEDSNDSTDDNNNTTGAQQ
jgi:chromosome segregation ATPase